jgi:3-deoxy-D-manno-octulosonic-acid transferase
VLILYRLLSLPAWLLLMTVARLLPKVRENLAARRGWERRLREDLALLPAGGPRPVWIHCASMGEFEAIRPLARGLRAGGLRVAITFFSTSGPRHLKGGVEADWVGYLPFDTPRAARRFLGLLRPCLALVTKHDLWPNHLAEAARRGVPLWFINANFHPRSRLASAWLRPFHRELLSLFEWIAAVSPVMAGRFRELLAGLPAQVEAPGDSRFDRVVERARESRAAERLPLAFREGGPLLVAGSTWEPDEQALLPAFAALRARVPELRLLLVPHEPVAAQLERLERQLEALGLSSLRLSRLEGGEAWQGQPVLIVDQVGLLAGLYAAATAAWVGGGFTTGVHSVIEPAAFGLPVLFGPRHHVSQEAQDLLACGGAREVADGEAAAHWLELLFTDEAARRAMAEAALALVKTRTGVTDLLLDRIRRRLAGDGGRF